MKILGVSSFYHDSAASLIVDGKIINAIEEERFSRIKHDNQFPYSAINYCLLSVGLNINDIDVIAYYEKPLLKFERILDTFVSTYPLALRPFLTSIPDWLGQKVKVEHIIKNELGFNKQIYYIPHHLSHASAAFYTSPFQHAALLTIDGVGEYQTTGIWKANGEKIKCISSINFPHSVGLLYSTFTAFLGFKVNEDEYKVMGLAAYGKPTYTASLKKIIDLKPDGSYSLNLKYFSFRENFQMWNKEFEKEFGPPRRPGEPILQRHKDIAKSLQAITEEVIFSILKYLYFLTKDKNLCLSGGVALNALANGKIYDNTKFSKIHIFGPAGDSGAAIGAALYVYHNLYIKKRKHQYQNLLFLGSNYSNESIKPILDIYGVKYRFFENEDELLDFVVDLLVNNKIVGWFQGKCEFGPRALGSRSILARTNPRSMKAKVNNIKRRESFRPFAGSILQEQVSEFFEVPQQNYESPYMNFCFMVHKEKRKELAAIVHKDNTCRIQTVNRHNGRYYRLIKKYYKCTKIPCLLNTSFNLKGEPIVENPRQALEDFLRTKLDVLVLEDYVIFKN